MGLLKYCSYHSDGDNCCSIAAGMQIKTTMITWERARLCGIPVVMRTSLASTLKICIRIIDYTLDTVSNSSMCGVAGHWLVEYDKLHSIQCAKYMMGFFYVMCLAMETTRGDRVGCGCSFIAVSVFSCNGTTIKVLITTRCTDTGMQLQPEPHLSLHHCAVWWCDWTQLSSSSIAHCTSAVVACPLTVPCLVHCCTDWQCMMMSSG